MVSDEMLDMLIEVLDEPSMEHLCEPYLEMAQSAIVSRMWPYDPEKTFDDVPEAFKTRAIQIAVCMLNKRGVEGEVRHVENGTTHEWGASEVPQSLFEGINPRVGVL